MLNAIAVSLTAYLLRQVGVTTGSNLATEPIPEDSWVAGIPLLPSAPNEVLGLTLLAVAGGIAYSVLLNRSRFGFDAARHRYVEPARPLPAASTSAGWWWCRW